MPTVTVAPALVLDDEMFELVRAALEDCAPEQVASFTWERFIRRESWFLVPDTENRQKFDEPWFKAEISIKEGSPYDQTIKLNYWRAPDLRQDGAPIPHNHPWPFSGHILRGGYREDRYLPEWGSTNILTDPYQQQAVGTPVVISGVVHQAGESNCIPLTTFHEVVEILEPGTLSLMNCQLGRKEGWGHLEDDGKGNLIYVPTQQSQLDDEKFQMMKFALNPYLRR